MRVVYISLFEEESYGGGEGRVAHELAQHFAARQEAVLICPGDETGLQEVEGDLDLFTVRSAGEGHVKVAALTARDVNRMFNFLERFDPDVVHAHEPASICLIGQIWAKMHNVPFVYTAHVLPSKALEFGALDQIKWLQSSLSESVAKQSFRDFYDNCDAIVALNRFAAADIRGFGYEGRLLIIPNGRDLGRFQACQCADIGSTQKTLTFTGTMTERKNQLYLLKALQHLSSSYQLQIIGEPLNPEYAQRLRTFADQQNLSNARFVGKVAFDEIPTYLEQTHVFVSASKAEVQSLVVIEALASGTPVVGLSNETIDELVTDEVGAALPKQTDPQTFARAVERVCTQSEGDYAAMCQKARECVQRHSWENVIDLTVEGYRSLLDKYEKADVTVNSLSWEELLDLLPPGEVKDLLRERVSALEERIRANRRQEGFFANLRKLRRVPQSTWFYAATTIVLSGILYWVLRHFTAGADPDVDGEGIDL